MKKIRVFHVEDYAIMRDGVRYLLERDPEITVVGEASSGEEMIERLKTIEADMVILDIYLDAMEVPRAQTGLELAFFLRDNYPWIKVIIHSTYDDAERVSQALAAGAKGFVSKRSNFDTLLEAVHVVFAGKQYICPNTTSRMRNLNAFLLGMEDQLRDRTEFFTPREREILRLLAEGKSSKQIADELSITDKTVESHRKNMMEKSHTKNSAELIAHAAALGLVKK